MKPLEGKVAVMTGASRGAGRGIACVLGEAGATVYVTGRSAREGKKRREKSRPQTRQRPETIVETAEMVTARGGEGIAARCDHTVDAEVEAVFKRGVRRSWHKLSAKHLQAYLEKMCFAFNRQKASDLFLDALRHMITAPVLTFEKLIA